MITSYKEIKDRISTTPPITIAIAGGDDSNVLEAAWDALRQNLARRVFVTGDRTFIERNLPTEVKDLVTVLNGKSAATNSALAVEAIRQGQADILMKGSVDSASFLRAVVDRDNGIRSGGVISNITVAEMSSYPKLLAATDNGIMPNPNLDQKKQIILNTAHLYNGLRFDTIKTAAIAATEKVSETMPSTKDAAELANFAKGGELPRFCIDGPFGYDVAVNKDAANSKSLSESEVAGNSDLLLFPNIDAANAVVKSWKFHVEAKTGSIVLGATVPILLNSRSDGP